VTTHAAGLVLEYTFCKPCLVSNTINEFSLAIIIKKNFGQFYYLIFSAHPFSLTSPLKYSSNGQARREESYSLMLFFASCIPCFVFFCSKEFGLLHLKWL
jgi:hypothetical protein